MADKILYYLGAGASANALPIAKSVYDGTSIPKIHGLGYALNEIDLNSKFNSIEFEEFKTYINELLSKFKNLSKKAEKYGDVDTYAKFLFLNDRDELINVKKTLGEFFFIKQFFFEARDSRYLPWLIGIMDQRQFPDNIKILSWNYDYQVELASAEFKFGKLETIDIDINGFSHGQASISVYPTLDPTFKDFVNLSIWHLNGIAGYYKPETNRRELNSLFSNNNSKTQIEMLNHLKTINFEPVLNFAWERKMEQSQLIGLESMLRGTSIMVVIGYSFPFYNRWVDKTVFNILRNHNIASLRKIYYQDPILDGKHLISKFNLSPTIQIENIRSIDNFHIPFEY